MNKIKSDVYGVDPGDEHQMPTTTVFHYERPEGLWLVNDIPLKTICEELPSLMDGAHPNSVSFANDLMSYYKDKGKLSKAQANWLRGLYLKAITGVIRYYPTPPEPMVWE